MPQFLLHEQQFFIGARQLKGPLRYPPLQVVAGFPEQSFSSATGRTEPAHSRPKYPVKSEVGFRRRAHDLARNKELAQRQIGKQDREQPRPSAGMPESNGDWRQRE